MDTRLLRCYLAFEMPEPVQAWRDEGLRRLREEHGISIAPRSQAHLTIKTPFDLNYGDVRDFCRRMDHMSRADGCLHALPVRFTSVRRFLKPEQVVYLGVRRNPALSRLTESVLKHLEHDRIERRAFDGHTPHVSLVHDGSLSRDSFNRAHQAFSEYPLPEQVLLKKFSLYVKDEGHTSYTPEYSVTLR